MSVALSDITVVVQGPTVGKPGSPPRERLTHLCLERVRKHLTGAEIILSTYHGSDVTGLSFDILVESEDPGATAYYDGPSRVNNVNRQIVTTRAGLSRATRPYALKIRSDLLLEGNGFLRQFGKYPQRAGEWKLLT